MYCILLEKWNRVQHIIHNIDVAFRDGKNVLQGREDFMTRAVTSNN